MQELRIAAFTLLEIPPSGCMIVIAHLTSPTLLRYEDMKRALRQFEYSVLLLLM